MLRFRVGVGRYVLYLHMFVGRNSTCTFDLPEAESELVSGYNVEYASITFAFSSWQNTEILLCQVI